MKTLLLNLVFAGSFTAAITAQAQSVGVSFPVAWTGGPVTAPAGAHYRTFELNPPNYATLSVPARNNFGQVAFKAFLEIDPTSGVTTANNWAIYAGNPAAPTLRARTGDFARTYDGSTTAAKFFSFSDPAYNNFDEIAFFGRLTGGDVLPPDSTGFSPNNVGLWSSHGGTLHMVMRKGDIAPGTVGATFGYTGNHHFALPDVGDVVFFAELTPGVGDTSPDGSNDRGIWACSSSGALSLIIRTGDSFLINGNSQIVKTLEFLPSVPYSPGQSRSFSAANGHLIFRVTFGTASQFAILRTDNSSPVAWSGGPVTTPVGARSATLGVPARNNFGQIAFSTSLMTGFGGVTGPNLNRYAIYSGDPAAPTLRVQSATLPAPGAGGGLFESFSHPVYNHDDEIAFRGELIINGTSVTMDNDTGLWSSHEGPLHLVAREGDAAPGTGSAVFADFTTQGTLLDPLISQTAPSFALPDAGDVVFLGKLLLGVGDATASNDTGIWAVDARGALSLLVRAGDSLLVNSSLRTIKALVFLPVVGYSPGQSRSFSAADGSLIYKALFTDNTSAILTLSPFPLTIDTTAPVLTLPANLVVEATGPGGAIANFSASATDNVDGAVDVTLIPASGSTFPLGTTTVNASATDAAGNTVTGSFTVTVVDTTPPETIITSALDGRGAAVASGGSSLSSSITFTFGGTDAIGVAGFQCSLDGSPFTSCTSPATYGLATGTHSFQVQAVDAAGNVDPTPATCNWTILTPAQAIQNHIAEVQGLVPPLNPGQANGLIAKLNAAIQQLNNGNPSTAVSQLNAFKNQVNAFMNGSNPQLTPAQGQPLITAAQAIIIAVLGG